MRSASSSFPLKPLPAACLLAGVVSAPALALPEGGQVAAGDARISRNDTLTYVDQKSERAVIDWRSFSIGAGERVHFQQPGERAAVLNRVTGEQASSILGTLSGTGQVVLVNPNGVLFGAGSRVDTGSFIATTANISTGNFMEPAGGVLRFDQPGLPGRGIEALGTITVAGGGLAALVAPHVRNDGLIQARLGRVTLAAGDTFALDLHGDRLLSLALGPAHAGRLRTADGKPVEALLTQAGTVDAPGGEVVLVTPEAARGLLDTAINMSGTVVAETVGQQGGRITLSAPGGRIAVAGALAAGGIEAGTRGGSVAVTGERVELAGTARIQAAGQAGGGAVDISGEQGLVFAGRVEAGAVAGAAGWVRLATASDLVIATPAAEALSRTLQSGTHVQVRGGADVSIRAPIDGRGGVAGASLAFAAHRNLDYHEDIRTADGALSLRSAAGTITAERARATSAGDTRAEPMLVAGKGDIEIVRASPGGTDPGVRGTISVYELESSGRVRIETDAGSVFVRGRLGQNNGGVSALDVVATVGGNTGVPPGEVTLSGVRLRAGGTISVRSDKNIRVFGDLVRAGPNGDESPFGLKRALPGFVLHSAGLGDQNLLADQRYVATDLGRENYYSILRSPGLNPKDLRNYRVDPNVPGLAPVGPSSVGRALFDFQPLSIDEFVRPGALQQALPGPAVAANPGSVEPSARAMALAAGLAAEEAELADEGVATGGPGVARQAGLGEREAAKPARDVLADQTHVVAGPACEFRALGQGQDYFGRDAFAGAIALRCP